MKTGLVRRRPQVADQATVVYAFITSKLGYCNALYVGLPMGLARKLQLVQNAATRLLVQGDI